MMGETKALVVPALGHRGDDADLVEGQELGDDHEHRTQQEQHEQEGAQAARQAAWDRRFWGAGGHRTDAIVMRRREGQCPCARLLPVETLGT